MLPPNHSQRRAYIQEQRRKQRHEMT
jgi:hypothetical protein